MNANTIIKFNNSNRQFYSEVKKRVDNYFKENNISKTGNFNMYAKTAFMLLAYFVPYVLLSAGVFESKLGWFFMSVLMGLSMAGIGLCVMHDANHGSYSKNKTLNSILSFTINMLGGHSINWRIQHNVIHHTFTNVHNHDEDITPPGFMRFEPHAKRKWVHKLQFIYAWFFYGMMTLMWSTTKDFKQLNRYNKQGLLKGMNTTYKKELTIIIVTKVLYFAYMFLPFLLVKEMTFLNWVVGYLTIHYIAGFVLAAIFQPAHVVEETEFPVPSETGNLENDWAVHQMKTTMNFATRDMVFSWLVGGLNYQVEHHLFPTICHVHYPKISEIVKKTAEEFNLPYLSKQTFVGALWSHQLMLWKLGRA
ncbi:MAG: Linoleoyl-CoA desaturase [Bacteroidetes bacterium]|jgi:linoleoyl-CoA desaturase|nr:Linoleoyl-CoA desaturase [Bacteroidota bacterium]